MKQIDYFILLFILLSPQILVDVFKQGSPEDQMKKEIPDTVSLRCECCLREEDVDLGDSNKNTTPYYCEGKARLGSIT